MTDAMWAIVGGAFTGLLGFLANRMAEKRQATRDAAEQKRADELAKEQLEKTKAELGQALYERVKGELKDMGMTIRELRQELSNAERAMEDMGATIRELRQELHNAQRQIEELRRQVRQLEEERDTWRQRYEAAVAAAEAEKKENA